MQTLQHQPIVVPFQGRDQWMGLREANVGASEVPALFATVAQANPVEEDADDDDLYEDAEDGQQASPYASPLSLWAYKSGRIKRREQSSANKRTRWGTDMEPVIAEGIARDRGWAIRRPAGYYLHPTVKRMGCSLDYEADVDGSGLYVPFEIKQVADNERWKWRNAVGAAVIPAHILLQVQHQMAVTGAPYAMVGVLFGGNDDQVFPVERDDALIAEIEAAVTDFWRCVDEGVMPEIDWERDQEIVKRLNMSINPDRVLDWRTNKEAIALATEMKALSAQANAAKKAADEKRAKLFDLMGDASAADLGDAVLGATIVQGTKVEYVREPYKLLSVRKPKKQHTGSSIAALRG